MINQQIAKWLGSNIRPAVHYKLDEKYRPVHLQKLIIGYHFKEGFSEFRFDMNLAYKLKGIIDAYSDHKPTLIVILCCYVDHVDILITCQKCYFIKIQLP